MIPYRGGGVHQNDGEFYLAEILLERHIFIASDKKSKFIFIE